jgi:hypothetical protein
LGRLKEKCEPSAGRFGFVHALLGSDSDCEQSLGEQDGRARRKLGVGDRLGQRVRQDHG